MTTPRAKETVGVRPSEPTGALYLAAKAIIQAKADRAAARKAARDSQPVPNWIAYKGIVFVVGENVDHNGSWLGGRLPRCQVCEDNLPPREHHVCSGFVPKFVERTEETEQKQEAKREEIRKSRPRGVYCSVCNELMQDAEEGAWHAEDHEGKPERERYALSGEDDDLSGYEDEPEEDYCEGDDDGYDCD